MALSRKNNIFCCFKQRRRNQQRNQQKTRKCKCNIKKDKERGRSNEKKEIRCNLSPNYRQKRMTVTMCLGFLGRTGRSFVKFLWR